MRRPLYVGWFYLTAVFAAPLWSHHDTLVSEMVRIAQAARDSRPGVASTFARTATLLLHLRDASTQAPLPGLVRITVQGTDQPVFLEELHERPAGWFSTEPNVEVKVPAGQLRVEAVHGLETLVVVEHVRLESGARRNVMLNLKRFYHA